MDKNYRSRAVETARKKFAEEEGKVVSEEVVQEALKCMEVGEEWTGDMEEDVNVLMDLFEFVE